MKTDLFQSCGHCWVFQICWHIGCSTFIASSFRIWNSSTGIPSPPLALFLAMLSKESTSWETLDWKKHKVESRLPGEISITSDMQMTPPYGRKWTKEPLDKSERGEWKSWFNTQHSETKLMASGPITSWQIDGETVETVSDFIFGGSKIKTKMVIAAMKLKDAYSLEGKLWPT